MGDRRKSNCLRFATQHQESTVSGMTVHDKHVLIVHHGHNVLYVYNQAGLIEKTVIPGLRSAWGLATSGGSGAKSARLVIPDSKYPYCLHWVSLSIQNGKCVVESNAFKQKISFLPWGVYVDDTNDTLMVADPMCQKIQVYHKGKAPKMISVSPDVIKFPHHVVPARPQGGFVISDNKNQLVWVNNEGAKVRSVLSSDKLTNTCDIVTDKKGHIVVADYDKNNVAVYSNTGKYICYLLTQSDGLERPTRLVLDEPSLKLWVGYGTPEKGYGLMCIDYPDKLDVSSTAC